MAEIKGSSGAEVEGTRSNRESLAEPVEDYRQPLDPEWEIEVHRSVRREQNLVNDNSRRDS